MLLHDTYRVCEYLVPGTSFHSVHTSVRNYKCRSDTIEDTKCSSHFRTNWYMITKTQTMNVHRFVANAKCMRGESGFQVSCSNASPYPVQTRSVDTIAASTTCCLRTTAVLCSTSVVPGTIHCCCDVVSCVIRPKSKLREVRGVSL